MKDLSEVIYSIRQIDDLGRKDTVIHLVNPVIKIVVTFIYLIRILSMKNFNFMDTIAALLYPILIFIIGKIPIKEILKKVIVVIPIVLGICILNLIINFSYAEIYFSILLIFKAMMTLIGSLLLIATTGMNRISIGLRTLKFPKILINQIFLLYRYIILMIEECYRIKCAYELRTLGKKSMEIKDFGKIMGHLLLKSIDRSEKVYSAMKLRGFNNDFYLGNKEKFKVSDFIYLGISTLVLILA